MSEKAPVITIQWPHFLDEDTGVQRCAKTAGGRARLLEIGNLGLLKMSMSLQI